MESLAYTYAALSYEEQKRVRLTVSPVTLRPQSAQRVVGAIALAIAILTAGIAGTMVSPFGVEAQPQNVSQSLSH